MPGPNQLDRAPENTMFCQADLLQVPPGQITEQGLRGNVTVAIRYLAAWLAGNGCVPIDNLMEDAATAEIARAQIWQWIRHPAGQLDDGRNIDLTLFDQIFEQELTRIRALHDGPASTELTGAAELLKKLIHEDAFIDFLTLPAYQLLP
jgi:malate synthase